MLEISLTVVNLLVIVIRSAPLAKLATSKLANVPARMAWLVSLAIAALKDTNRVALTLLHVSMMATEEDDDGYPEEDPDSVATGALAEYKATLRLSVRSCSYLIHSYETFPLCGSALWRPSAMPYRTETNKTST
ncbi:hypothetical protein YQE_11706, partial [Dendroctonus ponderosae]